MSSSASASSSASSASANKYIRPLSNKSDIVPIDSARVSAMHADANRENTIVILSTFFVAGVEVNSEKARVMYDFASSGRGINNIYLIKTSREAISDYTDQYGETRTQYRVKSLDGFSVYFGDYVNTKTVKDGKTINVRSGVDTESLCTIMARFYQLLPAHLIEELPEEFKNFDQATGVFRSDLGHYYLLRLISACTMGVITPGAIAVMRLGKLNGTPKRDQESVDNGRRIWRAVQNIVWNHFEGYEYRIVCVSDLSKGDNLMVEVIIDPNGDLTGPLLMNNKGHALNQFHLTPDNKLDYERYFKTPRVVAMHHLNQVRLEEERTEELLANFDAPVKETVSYAAALAGDRVVPGFTPRPNQVVNKKENFPTPAEAKKAKKEKNKAPVPAAPAPVPATQALANAEAFAKAQEESLASAQAEAENRMKLAFKERAQLDWAMALSHASAPAPVLTPAPVPVAPVPVAPVPVAPVHVAPVAAVEELERRIAELQMAFATLRETNRALVARVASKETIVITNDNVIEVMKKVQEFANTATPQTIVAIGDVAMTLF
jgi:hypothetical protein